MTLFFRPADGVAGDFIPFYHNGEYHLFYLKDYRNAEQHGRGTPWFHLVTKDFVHFEDRGEALARGAADAHDAWVYTGSVIRHGEGFRIYYTGHNLDLPQAGKPMQVVLYADSPDLDTWHKAPDFVLAAPTDQGYERDDWRDPFVFWNEAAGEYWMLLTVRKASGPTRHRGAIALLTSADLETWTVQPDFWAPNTFYAHPCPDLFQIGDYWYLVFAVSRDSLVTHYRMSRSLAGPWLAPRNYTLDGRAYGAAKSAGNEQERYLFGWLPTRQDERDDGEWQWGGELVVHETIQLADGTLGVRAPATILAALSHEYPLALKTHLGTWQQDQNNFTADSTACFSALTLGDLPESSLIEVEISYAPDTVSCGLLLRADSALEAYYQLRLEPGQQRMVIDQWPRHQHITFNQPFLLERTVPMQPNTPVRLRLLVEGSCLVVYANDEIALSCRLYDRREGELGLFVSEGQATFHGVRLCTQ